MTVLEYESRSETMTADFACSFAKQYPGIKRFYLCGDLGAGKTIFAKGVAQAYGIEPHLVVSPTFALVNRYSGGDCAMYHVDLYRIESEQELAELGLEELDGEKTVLVVEWSEKLGPYRQPGAVEVHLRTVRDHRGQSESFETPPPPGKEGEEDYRLIECHLPQTFDPGERETT